MLMKNGNDMARRTTKSNAKGSGPCFREGSWVNSLRFRRKMDQTPDFAILLTIWPAVKPSAIIPDMKKKVIFVCSANYYRSRYAEHYFNWLASRYQLGWNADSRGLLVGAWGNIGPISHHTVNALQQRGITLDEEPRAPKPLALSDLAEADLVVAVKEAEHRALMAEQFPLWKDRIEYWHVDDLDCAHASEALPHLEQQVHALVERLRTADGQNGP